MEENLIFNTNQINNPESGDITNTAHQNGNQLWYVIDAVSSCDDPRLAAEFCNAAIQNFCHDRTIKNRFDIGGLLLDLHEKMKAHPKDLTVCFAAVVQFPDGKYEAFNVGDSRVYEIQSNCLKRITRDDTYVQDLLDSGEINYLEAHQHEQKNFLKYALGNRKELKMNFYDFSDNTQGFLITSDGIHGELMDKQMEHVFFKENFSKNEIYEMLLKRSKVIEGRQDDQSVLIKWI